MVGTWVFEDLIGDVSVEGLLERWSRVAGTIANVIMYHVNYPQQKQKIFIVRYYHSKATKAIQRDCTTLSS